MSQTLTDILVVIAAVFLVWLVIRLFRKPIRWILKLLLNTAIGFAALFLLNFFGSAIGITLMLQANIGLEPWSVLQQGIAKTFGITYGTAASIVGAAVIAIAYFCGESFGLGTLANIFVCPIFIDILLYLNWVPLFERFSTGLAALLIGMELLALGTWMYMKSTLGSGPRDALMVVPVSYTHLRAHET